MVLGTRTVTGTRRAAGVLRVVVAESSQGDVVALAGCGTGDDREQAVGVVEWFYDAVRHDRAEERARS